MAQKLFILALSNLPFVNPDDIAKEIFGDFLSDSSRKSNQKMLQAGKVAIQRRKQFLKDGVS